MLTAGANFIQVGDARRVRVTESAQSICALAWSLVIRTWSCLRSQPRGADWRCDAERGEAEASGMFGNLLGLVRSTAGLVIQEQAHQPTVAVIA